MFYQNSAILSTIHLIEDHLSRLTSVYERIEERRTEDDILEIRVRLILYVNFTYRYCQ